MYVCSQLFQLLFQIAGTDSESIGFSGSVDVGKHHMVSERKSLGKLMEKGFRSRVGVRPEDAPDLLVGIMRGGLKRGAYLGRWCA